MKSSVHPMTIPALDTRYAKQWPAEAAVHAILLSCYAGLAATATGQLVAGITQTVFTVLSSPAPAPAALQTLAQFTSVSAVSRIGRYIYIRM